MSSYLGLIFAGGSGEKLCNCGEAKGFQEQFNRIAGGEKVEEGKYPWIVQMHTVTGSGAHDRSWSCTGALLDPTHVLTAAHCIIRSKHGKAAGLRAGNITLSLGTNLNSCHPIANCYPPVFTTVSDYTLHPTWETLDMLGSDVAVLTLTSPVQYSDKVKPICLPSNPGQNYVGKIAVASGFGDDVDGNQQSNLMETKATVNSEEDCFNKVKDKITEDLAKWNMSITDEDVKKSLKTKICTRGSPINNNPDLTTGTREGDSGSALNFEENGRFKM